MKFFLQYQDQFGTWKHYTMKHNERDAYRTMKRRAEATGKRMRMVDEEGQLQEETYTPKQNIFHLVGVLLRIMTSHQKPCTYYFYAQVL